MGSCSSHGDGIPEFPLWVPGALPHPPHPPHTEIKSPHLSSSLNIQAAIFSRMSRTLEPLHKAPSVFPLETLSVGQTAPGQRVTVELADGRLVTIVDAVEHGGKGAGA